MKMLVSSAAALAAALFAPRSEAALESKAGDGFLVKHVFEIAATPKRAWAALLKPGDWWPRDHTWSGDATRLSIDARAGGCYCERWKGGEAEHARVVMAIPEDTLRMNGALGPLQALAVTGVLTVKLAASDDGKATTGTVTYRVSGDSLHALEGFAPAVDSVIGQQFGRWARYAGTGKADARE